MVVHYPRTVWKNSYAEHEVTGKTYNKKKKKAYDLDCKIHMFNDERGDQSWDTSTCILYF